MGNITVVDGQHIVVDGVVVNDARVAAHLRFPLSAIPSIREALDAIELMAQPPASAEKN